ncbi:MAG: riboflavin synthase [Bryocella sp.]
MFTGLIESVGTVLALRQTTGAMRLIVAAPALAGRWRIGDSIAVNGVCLTAVDMQESEDPHPGRFAADLAAETLARTSLGALAPGSLVNLELPTPSGAPMGGHVVQGHVDGTGTLVSLRALNNDLDHTDWRMTVDVPESMVPNIVQQGSITIDGISLTVAKMNGRRIEIALIPHTYRSTNLRSLPGGATVNLEADILARYASKRAAVESLAYNPLTSAATHSPAAAHLITEPPTFTGSPVLRPVNDGWLTTAFLIERGY